jgi:hypothetical protein
MRLGSREEWAIGDGGMGSDQEVREDGLACASGAAVVGVSVAGEEGGGGRDLLDDRHRGEGGAKRFKAGESRRDLGQDDGVDDDRPALRGFGEVRQRPVDPLRVLGEDIEQDAAVDDRPGGRLHPRVNARISSVLSSTSPAPRIRAIASAARARSTWSRAPCSSSWNSTSLPGRMPSAWRTASGIVTWPFCVTRIA